MKNDALVKVFLEARFEERIALIKFIKQYYLDEKSLPLHEGIESYPAFESIRKSQSINFAPSADGCPLCGK